MVDDRLHNTTGTWSKHIDTVEFSLNSTVHSTTEYTPFKIYLGHNPLTPLNLVKESDALVDVTDKQIIESIKERKAIIKLVKRNICIGNQEMRFTWNKGKKENQIKVGDYVFYNNNRDDVIGKDGISTKKKKFNSKHIMLYDPKMNDNLINDVDDLLVENGATAETDRGSTVGDSSDDYDDIDFDKLFDKRRLHTKHSLYYCQSSSIHQVEKGYCCHPRAKRKFTLGTSKLARVEYLVKVGRALAWVPLPGYTLATKFSSAHSV
ncbi:hypothetical protein PPL_06637 [Heterostelium album PN500]|uniref:Uncharacterized protein n=1 Tax=Heterostelium pallidum (strain ATCC 26659 / Pp 5 / PN500) TaxID=670386 RepID=D3BFA4_HETP5|nr:hypothetical protein PPL_06637 [Heterostelium album PN500]EFA79818.1 hypothetical protein PPL_06637 [Heterostelium album PN500]|eukprot:XP_020431939.1 hypothetical protein PPL_06637 [Heterostelium album PN500]